ncbi:hypothetical protein C8J57DRAFT_1380014 [Mycena rebaudengoi]|nr:hypothetical protein C8J57DRAFT_1380014 [Mycena rebaudengoi]
MGLGGRRGSSSSHGCIRGSSSSGIGIALSNGALQLVDRTYGTIGAIATSSACSCARVALSVGYHEEGTYGNESSITSCAPYSMSLSAIPPLLAPGAVSSTRALIRLVGAVDLAVAMSFDLAVVAVSVDFAVATASFDKYEFFFGLTIPPDVTGGGERTFLGGDFLFDAWAAGAGAGGTGRGTVRSSSGVAMSVAADAWAGAGGIGMAGTSAAGASVAAGTRSPATALVGILGLLGSRVRFTTAFSGVLASGARTILALVLGRSDVAPASDAAGDGTARGCKGVSWLSVSGF